VRSGDDRERSVLERQLCEGDALLERRRAVVDAWQDVKMYVGSPGHQMRSAGRASSGGVAAGRSVERRVNASS
jgi:hypothetical protein